MYLPGPASFSDPDLRFLGHTIACDFFQHLKEISDLKIALLKAQTGSDEPFAPVLQFHYDPVRRSGEIFYSLEISMVDANSMSKLLYDNSVNAQLRAQWLHAVNNEHDQHAPSSTAVISIILPPGPAYAHNYAMTALLTVANVDDTSEYHGPFSSRTDARGAHIKWIHYLQVQ